MIKRETAQEIADTIKDIEELTVIASGQLDISIHTAAAERKIHVSRVSAVDIGQLLLERKKEYLVQLKYKAQSELNEDDGK